MNGQVERMNGILATKMRSLMGKMEVPNKYWPLAIVTAAFILNRTPSVALQGRTPLEEGTGEKPDLRRMKVFGCKAYVQIPKQQRRGKLNPTAWQGIMVGYSTDSPEWLTLDPRTNNIRKAYSAKFHECDRGFQVSQGNQRAKMFDAGTPEDHDTERSQDSTESTLIETKEGEECMSSGEAASGSQIKEEYNAQEEIDHSSRRSTRIRRQFDPNHMPSGTLEMQRLTKQIENDSTSSDDDEQDVDTDIPNAHENPNQCPTQQTEENNLGLCMAMTTTEGAPRSWKQAIHIRHWKNAMEKGIEQLEAKNAWILVDRTDDMKVLPGVWNFRTKKDENGDIVKHKAR